MYIGRPLPSSRPRALRHYSGFWT